MDAASDLMVRISLLPWLDLMQWVAAILSGALELYLGMPAVIALLMLGLVSAILGLINSWVQGTADDVDA